MRERCSAIHINILEMPLSFAPTFGPLAHRTVNLTPQTKHRIMTVIAGHRDQDHHANMQVIQPWRHDIVGGRKWVSGPYNVADVLVREMIGISVVYGLSTPPICQPSHMM